MRRAGRGNASTHEVDGGAEEEDGDHGGGDEGIPLGVP